MGPSPFLLISSARPNLIQQTCTDATLLSLAPSHYILLLRCLGDQGLASRQTLPALDSFSLPVTVVTTVLAYHPCAPAPLVFFSLSVCWFPWSLDMSRVLPEPSPSLWSSCPLRLPPRRPVPVEKQSMSTGAQCRQGINGAVASSLSCPRAPLVSVTLVHFPLVVVRAWL